MVNQKKILPRKVNRDRREFDNTYHPGVESADLYYEVHHFQVSERGPYPGTADAEQCALGMASDKVLCHNCNWNAEKEIAGVYTSRLKLSYMTAGGNSAFWDLGPNGPWILKDTPNSPGDPVTKDYTTQAILRERIPSLPLVEMHKYDGPGNNFNFIVMARAKEQGDVLLDLKEHIKQWCKITSPRMGNLDGSELIDGCIGDCTGSGCIKTGQTGEECWANLTPAIRKGFLWDLWYDGKGWAKKDQKVLDSWVQEADEKVAKLMAAFPKGGPYVFTHGDLHSGNIFISNDNPEKKWGISAILDWELAGFYPWWVESFRSRLELNDPKLLSDNKAENYLHPGHTIEDYEGIEQAVRDVRNGWLRGGNHTISKHGMNGANVWRRQPFCACQPYAQAYKDGYEQEHIDMFDVDSEDSQDDEDERVRMWPLRVRKFLRWVKEVHDRK